MEDLAQYLEDIAEPTVADFEQNPTSRRHAFLACVALFHSVDYLAYPKSSVPIRNEFKLRSADFSEVDRLAHAFKHVTTKGSRPLNQADVVTRPPAVWGEAKWDVSRWDDPVGGVTVVSDTGIDVLTVVQGALQFVQRQAGRAPKLDPQQE